jgi:hypothetical protein
MKAYADIAKLLLMIAVVVAAVMGVRQVLEWRDAAQANGVTVTQQNQTATATTGIVNATAPALAERARVDVVVTQARANYAQQMEEVVREDVYVARWRAGAIPERVRELARQRYCARYGSGRAVAGSGRTDATPRECGGGEASASSAQ